LAKFSFRLQTYLNLKTKIEDMKRNEFGKAVAAYENERLRLAELEQKRDNCVKEFSQNVETTIDPNETNRYNLFLERLKEWIKFQIGKVAEAEAFMQEKRAELVEAMKDKKTLETLKEKEYENYLSEEKKNEQKIQDDLVSYRFR